MNHKTSSSLVLIFFAAALLTGCNLPFGSQTAEPTLPAQELNLLATLTQQAIELDIYETQTAPTITTSPTITLTPLPPETITPTETQVLASPAEIKFNPGGTISYHRGRILAGQQIAYTLEAGEGQTLIATVSSPGDQVYMEITGLDGGEVFVPFSDGASSVQFKLPWMGDYQITLTSAEDQDFFLSVEVPANLVVSPGLGASAVNGNMDVLDAFHPDALTRVRYLIQLQAGSILDVQLSSQAINDLALALIGAGDGQPYLRHEVQSASISDLVISESQGYYLDVYSISGVSAGYSLSITVE